jgi:hypothetical protein
MNKDKKTRIKNSQDSHFSVNVKAKVHPGTGHESSEGEQSYSSSLSSTSTLEGGGLVNATPLPLYPPGKTRYPLYNLVYKM